MAHCDSATVQVPPADPLRQLPDMPTAWLVALLSQLKRNTQWDKGCFDAAAYAPRQDKDLISLLMSCRTMRDLVLQHRRLWLQFVFPINPDQAAAAQAKLQLACKYSTNIRLSCTSPCNQHGYGEDQPNGMILMSGRAPHELAAITHVMLHRLKLSSLVPSWLFNCTNLTSLHVVHCELTGTSLKPTPGYSHIKQLVLQLSPGLADQQTLARWQHELRALTDLTDLIAAADCPNDLLQCCSAIGPQLTSLRLVAYLQTQEPLQQLVSWFPRLSKLQLPHSGIYGEGMEALLSLPCLTHLECPAFILQHSYTDRPCQWAHLGFANLDIDALGRLPLHAVQSMFITATCGNQHTVIPSLSLDTTLRVAAAMSKCEVHWASTVFKIDNDDRHADTACVAATLPILATSNPTDVIISSAHPITPELLATITQHLSSGPLSELFLWHCTFVPDVWPLLLPSLPCTVHTFKLDLSRQKHVTQADIVAMCGACVSAPCPVQLQVMLCGRCPQRMKGWRKHAVAAMAAAGNSHMRLSMHD